MINVIDKSLAKSMTYNIGAVLPSESNLTELPFFQGCLIGVFNYSDNDGYESWRQCGKRVRHLVTYMYGG